MTTQPTPLPVSLFDIIAWVESKNNPHAMRFEPGVYARVSPPAIEGPASREICARIMTANNCSMGTADMIYSTSFGATQIMGFNLYDGLYSGDVVSFMGDPIAQAVMFENFCKVKGLTHSVDDIATLPILRHDFARVYNGDADAYAAQIVLALQHFGVKVTQ